MDRIIKNITDTAKAAAEGAAKAAKAASATEYIPYDEKYVKKEKQRKWQNKLNAEKDPKSNKSMADKHADTERGNRIRKAAGRKAAEAAKQAAKAAGPAAKAAGAANESRKMILKLTESDLHRIVKESVNRILREGYSKKNTLNLNESKTRKRAIKQAIEVGRRTIRGTVPDPIIERYVHEFTDKFMMGSPDYFYAYLPVLAEIAFRSKTRDEYTQVGEATMELSRLARMPEAREVIRGIRNANTVEDLECILNDARNAAMREE